MTVPSPLRVALDEDDERCHAGVLLVDRAAAIAVENEQPRSWELWIAQAGVAAPLPVRRAMARAFALGGAWSRVLPALARVDPAAVREVVDEFVAVFGPTG